MHHRLFRCLAVLIYIWIGLPCAAIAIEPVFAPGSRVSVAQFGAVPNDGQNDAPALRQAIEFGKAHPGIVLEFPPGIYNVSDPSAIRLMNDAMAGRLGDNPETTIFKPHYPYDRGLDLQGLSGITLEGRGAVLLFDGWLQPLSIDHSKDIAIRGLTIDYRRPAFSTGIVVKIARDHFDARIDRRYQLNAHVPIPRVMFWDARGHQMLGVAGDALRLEILDGRQTVRVYAADLSQDIRARATGNPVALIHSMHFRPAILIKDSDNVRIEDVTIHSQPGIGIVGHQSSNITLSGVRITPAPGSFVSTTTDATHFTSCTGVLRIEHSVFEGHGDDAVNVHSYYYTATKGGGVGQYTLTPPIDDLHAGVSDYPAVGDYLDLVRTDTLEPMRSYLVNSVTIHPEVLTTDVALDAALPDDLEHYYLVDATRQPRVEVRDNSFLSHRARGLLIKTSNVLVEHNLFFENSGTAIEVAAEGIWREGMPSANVVIRDNQMIGNGRGDGAIHGTSGISVNVDAKGSAGHPLHHGLLIEGNRIDGAGTAKCIDISQAQDVELRYNEFSGCDTAISTEGSEHVSIHDNITASH